MKKVTMRILAGFLALLQATIIPPSVVQMVTTRLERKYKKKKEFEQLEEDRNRRRLGKISKHKRRNR